MELTIDTVEIALEAIKKATQDIEELKLFIENQSKLNWKNCFQNAGFVINSCSNIIKFENGLLNSTENKNVFRTEKEAKSALAMAQLSHIIWVANGNKELLRDSNNIYYCYYNHNNKLGSKRELLHVCFLAFETEQIRDKVYAQHKQLIHDYLMID